MLLAIARAAQRLWVDIATSVRAAAIVPSPLIVVAIAIVPSVKIDKMEVKRLLAADFPLPTED